MSIDRLKASSQKNNTYILKKHDARNLNFIGSESIGLICTHPPYANIIKYSKDIEGDISLLEEEQFYKAMKFVAKESFRVLKRDKYCAILMGDMRRNGYIVPLGFNEYIYKSRILIKRDYNQKQRNCKSTNKWKK